MSFSRLAQAPTGRMSQNRLAWQDLGDELLLNWRLRDLGLEIRGTPVASRIEDLHDELDDARIRVRPNFWLAEEWFSPEDVVGIALPFYLAHPRLIRLERQQMLEAEGSTRANCMRILRHEMGHVLDTAFGFFKRRSYQKVFGKSSRAYPKSYSPNPLSRRHVLNLDNWYAQSHPIEDFAETFAVWLKPGQAWKRIYAGWPALEKLLYVDGLMQEIAGKRPAPACRKTVDPISKINKTLWEHYAEKRHRFEMDAPVACDEEVLNLFDSAAFSGSHSAASFIARMAPEIRKEVAKQTGQTPYTVNQVLKEMVSRCHYFDLSVPSQSPPGKDQIHQIVRTQTLSLVYEGAPSIAV